MVRSSMAKKRYLDENIWCQNHKETSYWMEGLSNVKNLMVQPPNQVDIAVVGSGYTGLNAALQTIRGGRSTAIFEVGKPGQGCSTKMVGKLVLASNHP